MPKWMPTLAGLLALLFTGTGYAQDAVTVELVPQLGAYLPTTALDDFTVMDPFLGEVRIKLEQEPGFTLAGGLTVWLSQVFGLEGKFAYAFSNGEIPISGAPAPPEGDLCLEPGAQCSARVILGSGRFWLRYLPDPGASWSIQGGAGVAMIGRGGDFWEGVDETNSVGAVLGLAFTFARSRGMAVRVGVEDYLYSASFVVEDPFLGTIKTNAKSQNDLLITGGLVVRLGN